MKIGVSTLGLYPAKMENILEFLDKNKIKYLEIIREYPYDNLESGDLKSSNINLTLHAPISDMNIASHNDKIRQASMDEIIKTFKQANKLDVKTVTIHPGLISPYALEFTDKILENNDNSIKALDKKAMEYGVDMCIENMPLEENLLYTNLEALEDLVENLNAKITLDVGHAYNNAYTLEEMLQTKKIQHINLNDNDSSRNTHSTLGSKDIDFAKMFEILRKQKYEGICVIEVNNMKSILKSIEYLKTIKIL